MREGVRQTAAVLVSVVAVFVVAALSRLPYGLEEREHAVVRLSWRFIGQRMEQCRPLTAEEEARLPRHMRPPEVCERRIEPYALTVWVDGAEVIRDTIHGAGAREDRPLYVFRELELSPGAHRLSVKFGPLADTAGRASLEFEEGLRVAPREIVLLTYDSGRGEWIVRRADRPS
jgi:hypothetical protein